MTASIRRGSRARRRRPPAAAVAVLAAIAALATACSAGGGAGAAAPRVNAALPLPAGVSTAASPPSTPPSGSPAPSCDAVASLRPAGPLPAPGAMPAGSTMERIQRRGYLIAGVDQDSYLFGYHNGSTQPGAPPVVGFDIDVIHQIAQAIFGDPNKVRFAIITQAQRIPAITSGQVDIVADSMTITCDRKQSVAFSTDYFHAGQRVLVDQNSAAASIDDLAGKKICAAAGTTSILTLEDPRYRVTAVSAVNWTDCLLLLQEGQVDGVSTDDSILAGLQQQDPYTKIVGPRFTQEPHGLAMPLGAADFVRFVNAVLDRIRSNGVWTQLYETWIGARLGPVPPPPAPTYQD